MFLLIVILIAAYLLGSIPTSVWLGRWFKGVDLREHGSGNAGATNAFRVLGKGLGITVFLLDMLKAYAAVSLSLLQNQVSPEGEEWIILRVALGMMAVVGHIFPLFAGFKGGKGVASMAGVGLALHPFAALCALGIYLLVFLISRISSLGSLAAVISYPIWMIWIFRPEEASLKVFSLMVPILVFITHRKNIRRLLKGKEK
jgi:acyl phosphate:glycerol-3-phosphate acyltransferase